MGHEALSEREFEDVADRELVALERALGALEGDVEADLQSGILTLEFADGAKYIVNSHRAARPIWMAADSRMGAAGVPCASCVPAIGWLARNSPGSGSPTGRSSASGLVVGQALSGGASRMPQFGQVALPSGASLPQNEHFMIRTSASVPGHGVRLSSRLRMGSDETNYTPLQP